jgi:glycine/D-amino acid oxidase-like deaminating enzyme
MAEVNFAESALPKQGDVVVVGAGLVGLFSAHCLERAGLGKVVVVERRNGVASLTSAHSAEGFRLEWDAHENIEMVRRSIDVFDNFADVVGVKDFKLDVRKNGYLFMSGATGPSYRTAGLKERIERWRGLGLDDVEYLTGDEVRKRFPFADENVVEGHYRAGDGFVAADQLARGLVLGGGFSVQLGTAVESVLTEGGRVSGVRTNAGHVIGASAVVVAAGAFPRALAATAGPELGLESRRRHGITAFLPDGMVDQRWPMVVDADLGLYWRPRPEGVFVGWEHALPWDEQPVEALDPVPADVAYLDQVRIHGARLTAFWKELRLDNLHWHAGQYVNALPYDGRPVIGEHPQVPGLWINTAYEGRGVMAGPGGAQLLARLMSGDRSENPFRVELGDRGNRPDDMVL